MTRRPRCVLCGSRQWHKEPSRALIVCSEGHVLENHRNESRDLDEFDAHTLRKRAIKSTRKKKDRPRKADPRLYHGARGGFHYFQCQQLLLRKQIVALIPLWNLPPEFEIICRDIWALHLSLLPNPPSPEPYFHLQEANGGQNRAGGEELSSAKMDDEGLDFSSDDEETEEGRTIDSELASLLRLNSESDSDSSSSSLGVRSYALSTGAVRAVKRRGHKAWNYDGPASTIAVLVVACWTLRLPRLYMDFVCAIEAHELPYMDPLRLLPRELTLHLTENTVQRFSPPHPPNVLTLHALSSRLARKMYERYGVWTPEANGAPALWRVIERMGGTPTLYVLTKALSNVLSLTLALDPSLAAPLSCAGKPHLIRHKFDNVPPEVALSCAAVVVLKMVYGLDGKARQPKDTDDPSCLFPRLEDYIAYLGETERKSRRAVVDSKSRQTAENWTGEMIDEYLTFCERALVDRDAEDGDSLLARYFPLPDSQNGIRTRREVREIQKELNGAGVETMEEGQHKPRPGEEYVVYSSNDVLGEVNEELGAVVGRVAKICGVDETYVMNVLEMLERRLLSRD